MTHAKARKRQLVDSLYELGLSISYDQVLEISSDLGSKICHHYMREKAICPPKLKHGLFTTAAVDNIDHNLSSTTAHNSFHGTGISFFQHPDEDCFETPQTVNNDFTTSETTVAHLPEAYTNVVPITAIKHNPPIPRQEGPNKATYELVSTTIEKEYE